MFSFNEFPATQWTVGINSLCRTFPPLFKTYMLSVDGEMHANNSLRLVGQEGRKEMFYLTTHSTHFIYGYGVGHMVKDHSDSERRNLLPPHRLIFPINSKGSFICTIPQT